MWRRPGRDRSPTSEKSGPGVLELEGRDLEESSLEDEPVKVRGWLFYGCIATLCVVTFVIAVDAVIIAVSLPVSRARPLFRS